MKKILLLLLIISTAAKPIHFKPQQTHSSHWKEYQPGGYWITNANLGSGDTLHMNKGVYTYISGENLNNVTILPDAGTEMRNGINLRNSSNIHIAGLDVNTGQHKLYIHDATGVGIQATGRCNNWEVDGVDQYNVYSWIQYKTEPDDFKLASGVIDSSYWHIVMSGLYVHDCVWKKSNFDGGYVGTTDAKADRAFVINGKTYFPYPAMVSRIHFKNVYMDTSYRTNLQVSVLVDTVTLDNVTAKNAGINSYLDADGKNQGANFIIGGSKNSIYASITNSTFKNANLYNVRTQAGGTIYFKNNTTDSSTAVYRIGKGFSVNTEQMASVEFDNPVQTYLDVEGNTIGYSNNNVGFVFYGIAKPGSKFTNNNLKGLYQNKTGVVFDTTGNVFIDTTTSSLKSVIKVKCDTVQINHHAATVVIRTVVNYNYNHQDTLFTGKNYKIRIFGDTTHTSFSDTVKPAYNDTSICSKCGSCDSIVYTSTSKVATADVQVNDQSTVIGIMPFKVANAYGVGVTRDAYMLEYFSDINSTNNLINRFNSYDTLLLNINHYSGVFTNDPVKHADSVKTIADKVKFVYLTDENEELNTIYYHTATIKDYCAQLVADAKLYPGRVCNGGFTMPLYRWYFSKTGDQDFANKCLESGGNYRVADQQFELDTMKAYHITANVHIYLSDTSQIQPIIRMLKYVKNYLGTDMLSNEFGIYKQDPALVKGIITIANAVGLKYVILYSGDGTNKAQAITETDFKNSIY